MTPFSLRMQLCAFSAFPAVPEGFVLHLATRAALGPAVTLLPCVPEKVALTGQKKTFLQRQGSKEECVPAASALVTPLDNSRP